MKDNLPMILEKSFIGKIKNFFRKLFFKIENKEIITEKETINNEEIKKNEFIDSIKTELDNKVQKDIERKKLFKKIRENQDILKTMSNEQLEKISNYYSQVIEENKKIIEAKKIQIKKLKNV